MTDLTPYRSSRVFVPVAIAALLLIALAPIALALDDGGLTDTSDTTLASETEESVETLSEPVDDTIETVEETVQTVEETLEPSPSPTESSPSPSPTDSSSPSESPTDSESDSTSQEPSPSPTGTEQDVEGDQSVPNDTSDGNRRDAPTARDVTATGDGAQDAPDDVSEDGVTALDDIPRGLDIIRPDQTSADRPSTAVQLPSVVRLPSGPRSTADLIERLGSLSLLPSEVARLLAPFPVAGPASYSDDWGAARHEPSYHRHEGVDVFAERGTPVIASADGTVTHVRHDTAIGGNSLRLTAADGTYFYYAHLDRFAARVADGTTVRLGDVLGYVGTSGNAEGTPPHLHFEIHPDGGDPVPPVPYLDRWLADARAAAGHVPDGVALAPVVAPAVADQPGDTPPSGDGASGDATDRGAAVQPPMQAAASSSVEAAASLWALVVVLGLLWWRHRAIKRRFTSAPDPTPAYLPVPPGERAPAGGLSGRIGFGRPTAT